MPLPPTSAHHTPHAFSAPLTSAEVNRPLGELDAAIAQVIATGSGVSTTLTAQATTGTSGPFSVASTSGLLPGDLIYFRNGATFESRVINTVPSGTTFTTTAVLTNTYPINGIVSKSPVEVADARGGYASLGARLATMVPASGPNKIEINGGFTNTLDSYLWIAGAQKTNPTTASQGIYVQHRVSGNAGAVVHDALASELRLNAITNPSFLNAIEASVVLTGGANTIADLRGLTVNMSATGGPTGTITAVHGIRVQAIGALGPTITTAYGIYVETPTGGATNYAIYAPTGTSRLGILETDGDVTVGILGTGARNLVVNGAAGQTRDLRFNSGGSLRWIIRANSTAEGGANAGSDLEIISRDDTGANIGTALTIFRSTRGIQLGTGPLGFFGRTPVAKKTGWATATGTATRTTFDTATVTTAQLAERVKALLDDLHATAGYGLIAT